MRKSFAAVCVIAFISLLPACSLLPQPSTPPPSASTTSPTASPSAVPSESAEPRVPDFSASCDEIVDPESMYEFNSNLGLDVDYSPLAGTVAATIEADGGEACGWRNLSSGSYTGVSLGEPGTDALAALAADVAANGETADFAEPGYFVVTDGVGEAVVFSGDGVIAVSSTDFYSAADAAQLMNDVIAQYAA